MKTTSSQRRRRTPFRVWLVPFPLLLTLTPGVAISQSSKLSASSPFNVEEFELSPDGRWVVYTDDALASSGQALHSVPLTREMVIRLDPPGEPTSYIDHFSISPDSRRAVFIRADRSDPGDRSLYSVPIGGPSGDAVLLGGPPLGEKFVISPDSSRVLFVSILGTEPDLFSAPIDGAEAAVPLHDGAVLPFEYPAGGIPTFGSDYFFTPDGSLVVYTTLHVSGLSQIYTPVVVSADRSSPPMALSDPIWDFAPILELIPDGTRALVGPGPLGELLSVPLDDPMAASTISLPSGTSNAREIAVSPDSGWVAFLADDLGGGVNLCFARLDRSGTAVAILGSELATTPVAHSFEIDPTSRRIVFTMQSSSTAPVELWSVLFDPRASPTKLNDPLVPAGGEVLDFQISPDGEWVVYRADQIYEDWPMGFRVPVGGPTGSAEPIWGLAPLDPRDWHIAPNGRSVVLASVAPFVDNVYRPWSVPLTGTPQPGGRELVDAAAFQPDGDVVELRVGAGGHTVYLADQDEEGVLELYLVTLLFADGFESGDTSAWTAAMALGVDSRLDRRDASSVSLLRMTGLGAFGRRE